MTISFGEGELAKILTDYVKSKFSREVESVGFYDDDVEISDLSANVVLIEEVQG